MYVPLKITTDYSILKSLIKIDDLITFLNERKISSCGICDDNLYGSFEFYNKCIKNNIKPIIGLSINLDAKPLYIYAINYKGFKNLLKIHTIKEQRKIDIEDLIKYKDDILVIIPYESIDLFKDLSFYDYVYLGYSNIFEKNNSLLLSNNIVYIKDIRALYEKDTKYLKYLSLLSKEESTNNNYYEENINDVGKIMDIVNLIDLKIPSGNRYIPKYIDNSEKFLEELAYKGLYKRLKGKITIDYKNRLEYEISIIKKMGFVDYFLIVYDYVLYAKKNSILVGPGRGSAAGSLVSYVLGITDIDPIKYNLLFERFLNPERITMPDIDVDFEDTKREEVIKYCIDKYGEKKVALIVTFGTLAPKQAIKDVARTLDINLQKTDNFTKLIDSRLSLKENYQFSKVKRYLEMNPEFKTVYKIALKFEGLKRHTSLHAAGIVMSKYNLDENIPLDKNHGVYATEYDKDYLEELGLLKMDFLGLKNLSLIANILDEIKTIEFDTIKEDDEKALEIFKNVNTTGIFQFESEGMKKFLHKFRPETFEDIVSALALFRPGPMKNIDSYIRRKRGLEKIDYLHENLKPILKPTYGIIVYQEQIMQIANIMAGYSMAEADLLRRAMSKKSEAILLKEKDKFIKGSIKNGYDESLAHKIYDLIFKFADYGFNRSHSVAYAMISYRMAYLKAHYPLVFMKNLLSSAINSETKTKEYIYECTKNGITIAKPNINISDMMYIKVDNKIVFPLTNIKNVGVNAAKAIIEERKNGKFKDIFDFICRCYKGPVNSKTIENLIYAGAFDSFGYTKKTLIQNLDIIINYSEIGSYITDDTFKPELEEFKEFSKRELMQKEEEIFGFYLTAHPVTEYKKNNPNVIEAKDIGNYFDKTVEVIVSVDRIKRLTTKKNEQMMFITGSDELSQIDIVVFPRVYEISPEIEIGDILDIKGKIEKRYDQYQIITNKIIKLEN